MTLAVAPLQSGWCHKLRVALLLLLLLLWNLLWKQHRRQQWVDEHEDLVHKQWSPTQQTGRVSWGMVVVRKQG